MFLIASTILESVDFFDLLSLFCTSFQETWASFFSLIEEEESDWSVEALEALDDRRVESG